MADTRDRILAATNESFRRRGYHGTSIKDVTRAAGATIGSLYHFFPGGKTALAEAVIIESGAAYRRLFELIADEAADPAAAITAFFDGAALVLEDSDFLDVCPIGTVAREVASTDDDLRTATDAVFRSWIDAAAERFTPITPITPITPTTPTTPATPVSDEARALATTVVAALEGGLILARARRDATILQTIGRQMAGLVSHALATRPPASSSGRPPRSRTARTRP
ncbi:MAG: helix-turn-helix domain-containing protein [Acidimicrobiales bacterium]